MVADGEGEGVVEVSEGGVGSGEVVDGGGLDAEVSGEGAFGFGEEGCVELGAVGGGGYAHDGG